LASVEAVNTPIGAKVRPGLLLQVDRPIG